MGGKKRDLHFQLGVSPGSCDCPRPRAPDGNVAQEGGDCRAPPQHPDVNVDFFLSLRSQQRLCGLASRAHRRSLAPTLKLGARGGKPRCEPVHTVISIWQSRFFLPCMDVQFESKTKKESIPLISQTRAARGVNKSPFSLKLSELGVNGGPQSRARSRG